MNVVATGTSSGIGLAIAEKFVRAGHTVWGFDKSAAVLEHERYHHVTCDICSNELPRPCEPEILVSCAGTLEESDAIEVNLMATMRFSEFFESSPCLRSVLFVASASARNGAEFPRYVASKAGLVGYMKNRALALAERGVTCNSVSPGGVITPANHHILDDESLYAQVLAETLLGKWAEPSEVAELVYFLTVTNRSITGEDVLIDNGEMLRSNFVW